MRNLILIGLPGSGKTAVGKLLAARLSLSLADCDAAVERHWGMTVPEIFAAAGEEGFRCCEAECLARLCARNGQVIATGGGAVLRAENRAILRRSGWVVFLDRDPDKIMSTICADSRPLLQEKTVAELSRERRALYEETAHLTVRADSPEAAADIIERTWRENT